MTTHLCPHCHEPVDSAAPHARATLQEGDDTSERWFHPACFSAWYEGRHSRGPRALPRTYEMIGYGKAVDVGAFLDFMAERGETTPGAVPFLRLFLVRPTTRPTHDEALGLARTLVAAQYALSELDLEGAIRGLMFLAATYLDQRHPEAARPLAPLAVELRAEVRRRRGLDPAAKRKMLNMLDTVDGWTGAGRKSPQQEE